MIFFLSYLEKIDKIRRNLYDSEIEDLEGLMRSLDGLHQSPSISDARS